MANQLNKTKFLSEEEANHLTTLLTEYHSRDPRNTTILQLSLHTGARPSEILGITKADLNPENNTVFIHGLKGSRDRELPLPEPLFNAINDMAAKLDPEQRIFPIALRTLQTVWHHYRPAKKGIKSLRHTFAIRLYQKTKDIRLVQMALGHRSILNTMVYADYVYNQEELRKLLL